ncbi:transposase, partial [Atopobacter phocae]|uniref:transposase n=1 Tax=Atopobacter phocae TaxID=136492 RepID=UPI00046F373A
MRKNKRHSANELMYFIDLYLISGIPYVELQENYGLKLNNKNFRKYLNKYRIHGPSALISKGSNNNYSEQFKKKIIEECLSNEASYLELATKYNIPS